MIELNETEIQKLYSLAREAAKELLQYKYRKYSSKDDFKNSLYNKIRFKIRVKPNQLCGRKYGKLYYHCPPGIPKAHENIAELFKRRDFRLFSTPLSKGSLIMNKILDQVTDDYFTEEDKTWFELDCMIKSMDNAVNKMSDLGSQCEELTKEVNDIQNTVGA